VRESVFVDSWAWIATVNPKDGSHEVAKAAFETLKSEGVLFVTSNLVLAESITYLRREGVSADAIAGWSRNLSTASENGNPRIVDITAGDLLTTFATKPRFGDKPDFTAVDITIADFSRANQIRRIFTADADFTKIGMGFVLVP